LLWFSRKIQSTSWALMGGILLGGVVGNLIDRLTRDPGFAIGHVVDFIQIPFNFAVFNIADIAIVSMCVLAAIRVIRGEKIGQN
jgi:signal peptidase II